MGAQAADFDVTVCIPTYNGALYIEQALASLFAQTFEGRIQVLVCDDASGDGTADVICAALAKTALSHRVVRNKANLGMVGNWNQCLSLAEGRYIAFLFQDDWFEPEFLARMVHCADSEGVNLVLCDRRYHFEPGADPRQREFLEVTLPRLRHLADHARTFTAPEVSQMVCHDFLGSNFLGEPDAGLIRRSAVSELGLFDTTLKQICDFEYWLRIGTNGPIGFIPDRLINFRVHGDSTTSKNARTNASTVDRIIVGHRFLSEPAYSRLRQHATTAVLEALFRRYLAGTVGGRKYARIRGSLPKAIHVKHIEPFKPSVVRRLAYWVEKHLH